MSTYAVRGVRAVLPDRVVDDATVVVEDGRIASIAERGAAPPGTIDGRGAFCIPGLVDTHSDGLEKELRPRPGVELPLEFALASYEGRIRAAGITTMYHGVAFEESEAYERSVALADALCDALEHRAASGTAIVDHRILYRLDARDHDGFTALVDRLPRRRDDGALPLVSFEDHTPGQGQYADRSAFERYLAGTRGLSTDAARRYVDEFVAERARVAGNRDAALPWLTAAARSGTIRLMAHDPATVDDVDEACSWHAAIAEFPTTVDAARRAVAAGMRTVCGAPNVLRGGSHSGNVSAEELIERGVCHGLSSDYLPSALLGAVGALVTRRVVDLPTAVGLVTSGPADTVGLGDRGRLVPGARGDLALVTYRGRVPTVRGVHRAEDHGPHGDDDGFATTHAAPSSTSTTRSTSATTTLLAGGSQR